MPRNPPETSEEWRARGRAYYHKHKEEILATRRARVAADPSKRREYDSCYYSKKIKPLLRRYKYGIEPEVFAARLAAQSGICVLCGTDKPGGKGDWVLDHSHEFSQRDPAGHRGILCVRCNVMLGMARDNPATLRTAADYIASWTRRQKEQPT